jgi:hypothetical protein
VTDATPALRLALDQNFPTPLIDAIAPYLPPDLELRASMRSILDSLDLRTVGCS